MYINIKRKVKRLRVHLVSSRNSLIKQIELKNEITEFVRSSEEKLNYALQQTNFSSTNVNILRENLADDQRLYTECEALIQEFQAEINATKKEIKKSNLKYHNRFSPQKTGGFFKSKNENHAANFSHQVTHPTLQDKLLKGA